MTHLKTIFAVGGVAFLASCSVVGPLYERPTVPITDQFALQSQGSLALSATDRWWQRLDDPVLNALIEKALARNIEIDASLARIREAEAILTAAGPASDLSGNLTINGTVRGNNGALGTTQGGTLSPNFVIDLFGTRKKRQELAAASLQALVEENAALRLSLQAQVTQTYLQARFLQESVRIRQRAVQSRRRLVSILEERGNAGTATRVELRRGQAELRLEESLLPQLEGDFQSTAFALATLVVEPGQKVLHMLRQQKSQPIPSAKADADVPAALLRNRPDIRASEARLMAAVSDIGITEAQLYPTFSLGGSVGIGNPNAFSFGPSLVLPVFDLPARRARVEASRARAEEAEALYRQTVLAAVEEVQVNLARSRSLENQIAALNRALTTYRDALELSRKAFQLNSITLVEILDAEEELRNASLRLAAARRDYASTWALLNVAIGQGRDVEVSRDTNF